MPLPSIIFHFSVAALFHLYLPQELRIVSGIVNPDLSAKFIRVFAFWDWKAAPALDLAADTVIEPATPLSPRGHRPWI
jgi:hypothetical protein